MGLWGTNNYELCCQQGTSDDRSRTFHNSWAPATTSVLNTPPAGQLTEQRFKNPSITIETSCFHNPTEQRGADYAQKHQHRLPFSPFSMPVTVSEGKTVTDVNRSGSCGGLDAAGHTVVNAWELRGRAAWRRENNLWPNRKKIKQWRCCLTSNWQAVRAELKIGNGLCCAPLGQKKGLFDRQCTSTRVGVWI